MRKILMAAVLSAVTFPALAATGYTFTVLGELDSVYDINNLGVGVGQGGHCCDFFAQTYSSSGISPVPLPSSVLTSDARGINDHGTIVGTAWTVNREYRAFVYTDGAYRELGSPTGDYTTAHAINNAGSVLVKYSKPNLSSGSYVWSEAGGMVDLGSLGGGYTSATALNERGQVAGVSSTVDGKTRGFRWTDGKMEPLYIFPGEYGFGVDGISEQGDVFGHTDEQHSSHAFMIRADGTPKTTATCRGSPMSTRTAAYTGQTRLVGVSSLRTV